MVEIVQSTINRELAIACGFLLAACLIFGTITWMSLNYIESDIDRFSAYLAKEER